MTGAELDELSDKVRVALKAILPEEIIYFAAFFEDIDCKIISNIEQHKVGSCLREIADRMDQNFLVTRN